MLLVLLMDNESRKPRSVSIFPRGLNQPAGSARFGLDALLLGSFAARIFAEKGKKTTPVCDLGCGCGAAIFAFLLSLPEAVGIGADREELLLEAARDNAHALGLKDRAQFVQADLGGHSPWHDAVGMGSWLGHISLVMANPPWHERASGRIAVHTLKARAHMAQDNDFFCAAATRLLAYRGFFAVIIPAKLMGQFHLVCQARRLGIRQILPVATRPNQGASRLLLLAQKDAKDDMEWLPQLQIHGKDGENTTEAKEFCHWL